MDIQHRFGTVANGYDDFWGLCQFQHPHRVQLCSPLRNLQIGFGFTKENKYWDFNAKCAASSKDVVAVRFNHLFRQCRD